MRNSEIHAQVSLDLARTKLQHFPCQRRLDADPESVVHHIVGIGQVAADPEIGTDHVGLAGQVAGEQQAGADLVLVEVGEQFEARHRAIFLQRDRKAEP